MRKYEARHVLITMEITEGEHEHTVSYTHRMPRTRSWSEALRRATKKAEADARSFYDAKGDPYLDGYLHCCGSVYVKVFTVQALSEMEYEVLTKYI